MKRIVVFGATSAIAVATAMRWAAMGHQLCLVGRDEVELLRLAQDLRVRGATVVEFLVADLNHIDTHAELISRAIELIGEPDIALIAHGVLGDQHANESSFSSLMHDMTTNALSAMSLINVLARVFESRGAGSLIAISSVAGDRGRRSNYSYGTAKAAVSTFLQGVRQRLYNSGVHVLTVKPGFVDTPMTEAFEKNFLWVPPERVANGIVRAVEKKRDVIYTPWFWRFIMIAIRSIPEPIFKRMSL